MSRASQYHEIGSPAQPLPSRQIVRSSARFLASVSANLVLIGFLLLPLAFGDKEKSASVNKTATVIVASILVGIAYSFSLFLVLFYYDERTFLIHSLLIPGLISNLLALFNVLLNVLYRDLIPMGLLEILSLTFSSAFAFLYALGALWLYSRDVNASIAINSNRGTILLTDEEMQRQQLQRLLDQNSSRNSLTPKAAQKTFQVNHPSRLSSFPPPRHEDGYYS
ncbi:hypothetical protein BJX63DRAFT_429288 [Aspergillus granulosus]|uniref:MARVEL domain-containing protein n=1 Tax=Aspergillus granulosus TaxID=176169 RepID=A0ABR4HS96_9EURO